MFYSKAKYNLGKVIVVADNGMMNKGNIVLFDKENKAAQYEYIVGERYKNLPHVIKAFLINKENYKTTLSTDKENPIKICAVHQANKTIIGT